ncbi:MAG: TonB family protein [Gammaproteobacteria bacterium]
MSTLSPPQPSNDRLGSTLFVAALIHGIVILGVTFTVTSFDDKKVPSLNVVLEVETGKEELAADTADFLSNRSHRAAGQAAKGTRPTTALSATQPLTQAGDPQGADAADGTPRDSAQSTEQVVTRGESPEQVAAQPQPTDDPAPTRQRAAALFQQTGPQTTAMEVSLRAELPSGVDATRTLLATPSTQQSGLAEYLDSWRRRVERIGTANYPAELLGDPNAGRPTLEVVIGKDGQLVDIIVRQSSGDNALDQAALKILRLASPFEPLPQVIRKDYDVLRFAYDWDFFEHARRQTGAERNR